MKTLAKYFLRSTITALSMFLCGLGIFLQREADIGLSPWNALNEGVSVTFPISYGTASILIGFLVIGADLLMREPIGIATFLDAIFIGWSTDRFYQFFHFLFPRLNGFFTEHFGKSGLLAWQIFLFVFGLAVVDLGQAAYMHWTLGCGPRDTLLVALGKRMPKHTIGTVNTIQYIVVLIAAVLLGAKVGIGTVISVFLGGLIMDGVYGMLHFEPRSVHHESLLTTAQNLHTALCRT